MGSGGAVFTATRSSSRRGHFRRENYGYDRMPAVSNYRLIAEQMIDSRRFSVFIRPSDPLMNFTRFMRKAIRKHKMIGRRVGRDERRPVGLLELATCLAIPFRSLIVWSHWYCVVYQSGLIRQSRWPNGRRGERRYAGILLFPHRTGWKRFLLSIRWMLSERRWALSYQSSTQILSLRPSKAQAVLARGVMLMNIGHRHSGEPFSYVLSITAKLFMALGALSPAAKAFGARGGGAFRQGEIWSRASYHASCGGHTEAHHEMWGGRERSALQVSRMASRLEIYGSKLMRYGLISEPLTSAWCRKGGRRASTFGGWFGAAAERSRIVSDNTHRFGELLEIQVQRRGRSGRLYRSGTSVRRSSYCKWSDAQSQYSRWVKKGLWYIKSRTEERMAGQHIGKLPVEDTGHGVGLCQHGIGLRESRAWLS